MKVKWKKDEVQKSEMKVKWKKRSEKKESEVKKKEWSDDRTPTRLRVLRDPVRISVAYGNIPAPGLGKWVCASQEFLQIVCGCFAEWFAKIDMCTIET